MLKCSVSGDCLEVMAPVCEIPVLWALCPHSLVVDNSATS